MERDKDHFMARIPARSQQQAMDWSLVLASQAIESVVDYSPDPPHWGLIVEQPDYERALGAIKQFQIENSAWPWRGELYDTGPIFDAGSVAWAVLVVCFFWFQNMHDSVTGVAAMDPRAVAAGQWWRLFTAVMLHGDLAHLVMNVVLGVLLIGLVMGRYGTGLGLLISYVGGVLGNVVSWQLGPDSIISLGASGMVFSALGLLAAQSVAVWWKTRHAPGTALAGFLASLMLLVLLGLGPQSNIFAHIGGFVAGVVTGVFLARSRPLGTRPVVNLVAGLVFSALVIWPWLTALAQL